MVKSISERMSDDPQLKKYFIVAAVLVLVFIIVFVFIYIQDFGGQESIYAVHIREVFQLDRVTSRQITLRDSAGEKLVYIRDSKVPAVQQQYSYKGNTVTYGGGHDGIMGPGMTLGYTFSDGSEAALGSVFTDSQQREVLLMETLRGYFDNISLKYKYPFYYVLLLLFSIAIVPALLHIIFFTEDACKRSVAERLFIRGGEPTGFAVVFLKVGSGVILALWAVMYLSALVFW